MSQVFQQLIRDSRRISRDDFARNFGGVAEDVFSMLTSPAAADVVKTAREIMTSAIPLPSGKPRLRAVTFGLFSTAPELEKGEVAAVDGTTALPMQLYSAGQALCVGIGSVSHRRPLQDSLHYWSSKAQLDVAQSADDFIKQEEKGLYGISQTAYLRYFEVKHGLEIKEPYVLFDGTLVYEWLTASQEGIQLYQQLFRSNKKVAGVMKNLMANPVFTKFAKALKPGEIYVHETLAEHLSSSRASNANHGEARRYTLPEFLNGPAQQIWRGVFKPSKKAFGFEVHEDHLEDMLRIIAADAQLNHVGHEIPYLLNRVDEEVRAQFKPTTLRDVISSRLAAQSEELFIEEGDERGFR